VSEQTKIDFLVVDDDELFRNRLIRALSDRGLRASGAASVSDARERLPSLEVEKVVLDLRMPDESGLALLEDLRERMPQTRVVILTGYGSIATATQAIKLGATHYLTKPVGVEEILQAFSDSKTETAEFEVPSLEQVEWEHIHRILSDCEGNVSRAAKLLGMHRRSLQRKLQKLPADLK